MTQLTKSRTNRHLPKDQFSDRLLVNIVSPNPETGVIGWVQVEPLPGTVPLPLPSEELLESQRVARRYAEFLERAKYRGSAAARSSPKPTLYDQARKVLAAIPTYQLYLIPPALALVTYCFIRNRRL